MHKIGDWHFEVYLNQDGSTNTHWSVHEYSFEPDGGQSEYGAVQGTLWDGIAAACDALGILYPLVMDPDLAALSGLEEA